MKKGFTLIELLAVIVILAIVALITIPLVLGVIDKVQKSSYKESLRSVFGAADLYIASSEFEVFPEDGINVVDTKIQMKNKNFTSGKIIKNEQGILELDKVSNGKYCAGGTINNIVIVTGSCDALDITPPTITIASNLVTSSSITIVASAEDLESGINGYQFSKDNGNTWTTKQISNVYNFTGLTNNTNYTFKVRVYNNNELSTISEELNVATVDIPMPTYSINPVGWTSSAVVTITYPEREDGYIYEYSLDNALTWETVEEPAITKEITFNENGNVIARILDGTNEVSGMSYSVTTIDDINPTVTFSMDGNSTYAKIRATLVTVSDLESGVNPSSLKYLWTTSTTTPSEASFTSTFTNGNAIITPEGVTGEYYLWILASDNTDNKIITRSNVFNLDNTAPVITVNPATVTVYKGTTYMDTGVTATDNINGNITSSIVTSGNVNTNVAGSYTLTYNVSDSAGNAALAKTRTVNVLETTFNYTYTGNYQIFTAPYTGNYNIQLWGARGGSSSDGQGAYVSGRISLLANTTFYIYIGQRGGEGGYNGGGHHSINGIQIDGYNGGGATDIRLVNGVWNDFDSLKSRIIVAAGGGGNSHCGFGAPGGGLTGLKGVNGVCSGPDTAGLGASQTSGGLAGYFSWSGTAPTNGIFGVGGSGNSAYGGGGGGGYYGGGGSGVTSSSMGGGGSGSSFISGYLGCNAISSSSISTNITHTGQPNHYSGYVFSDTQMISGNSSMPNPSGGTMIGNNGNGYARIVFIP